MSQSTDTAAVLFVIPDPWANYSPCSIGTLSRRRQAIIQLRQDTPELGEYRWVYHPVENEHYSLVYAH
jgi:hypothetical protein